MDFSTFVMEGYEVYAEGTGSKRWVRRRFKLDAVAR